MPKDQPPYNNEAEQAFLGALLVNPDAIDELPFILREAEFYVHANRVIYKSILSLFEKKIKPDIITLTEELRLLDSLDSCGGPGYIASLTSVMPSSANMSYYGKLIREAAWRREFIKLAAEIHTSATEESIDVMFQTIEQKVFSILQDDRHSVDYKKTKELVPKTIQVFEANRKNLGLYSGIPTGFTQLDRKTSGFQKSELIIIGARPGVGKTALALTMAHYITLKDEPKRNCAFFSLEMADTIIMNRLFSLETGIPANLLRTGQIAPSKYDTLLAASNNFYVAPLFIVDAPYLRLSELRNLSRRLRIKENIDIIFIDYLTLITNENPNIPRHEQVAEISRALKALARELDVPIVVLSQIKREAEHRPSLSDLRESGSIEQDADIVLFLWKDPTKQKSESGVKITLIIAKNRNGEVGEFILDFNPKLTQFSESIEQSSDN